MKTGHPPARGYLCPGRGPLVRRRSGGVRWPKASKRARPNVRPKRGRLLMRAQSSPGHRNGCQGAGRRGSESTKPAGAEDRETVAHSLALPCASGAIQSLPFSSASFSDVHTSALFPSELSRARVDLSARPMFHRSASGPIDHTRAPPLCHYSRRRMHFQPRTARDLLRLFAGLCAVRREFSPSACRLFAGQIPHVAAPALLSAFVCSPFVCFCVFLWHALLLPFPASCRFLQGPKP